MPQIKKVKQWVVTPDLPTGIYRHYKGGMYQVLGLAEQTETYERLVIYISLDIEREGPRMRARPLAQFEEMVRVHGIRVPRFEFLGNYFVIAEELEDNADTD